VNRKQVNLYRLTYRPAEGVPADGTHEWRRIVDSKVAEALAEKARQPVTKRRSGACHLSFGRSTAPSIAPPSRSSVVPIVRGRS